MAESLVEHRSADDSEQLPVIVVGAGPVGLLTALRLAQGGVPVTLLEANPQIESSPRAMAYQPPAVKELDRAGILEDVRKVGGRGNKVCWRRTSTGEVIAELERNTTPEHPYENLVIGQHELAEVILRHFEHFNNAQVCWNHRVIAIIQADDEVSVTVEAPGDEKKVFHSRYVVGADGGKSSVRRLCNIPFEGFTWPQQLVSTNVFFPFDQYGWYDANFMIDPEHWALIARIDRNGLWRVSYGEETGLSNEQLRERLPMKYGKLFPGPRPVEYKLDQFSPYRIHQKCATTFRQGGVLLAGDAAHLCNPMGGLGLTGGLLDAAALADALIPVCHKREPDNLLDMYAEVRRNVFVNVVNPTSQANKRRLHEFDPVTIGETDPFLMTLRAADAEKKQNIRAHAALVSNVERQNSRLGATVTSS